MKPDEQRKTILIADDVQLFIQLQISYLGRQRFDIHTADNGREALDKARQILPHLILLDLHMPDMSGDQVCRILKADPATSSIPVVIVSSGSREFSRNCTIEAGCDALIYKPVRRDLLLTMVEDILGTNQRNQVRVSVILPCTILHEGKETLTSIHSLCSEGAFIESDTSFIRGDMFTCSLTLPDEGEAVRVHSAAVMWTGSLRRGGPRGVGVKFLSLDPDSRARINEFMRLLVGTEEDEAGEASHVEAAPEP
ncbi:MAG: response regulator [bacterium]|nr:MAG: response regulator [bacterium]